MRVLRSVPVAVPIPQSTSFSLPTQHWWFRDDDGHVTAAEIIVRDDKHVDARILLDNALLYQSRHSSRAAAERELAELRQRLTRGQVLPPLDSDDPI